VSVSLLQDVHHLSGVRGWLRRQLSRSLARVLEWTTRLPARELNVSRITEQLLVGGHVPVHCYARLKALGISHVIDVRAERCDDAQALAALGIELIHLPARDRHALPVEALLQGVRWAGPRLAEGAQVFCHCEHGVGRGPLMAIAILVGQGWDVVHAYRTLRKARWQSRLNDRQIAELMRFVEVWARESPRRLEAQA
jgi:Dual specificity phosphatase, catalytic domain